jgi:UDP-2,3-diacylglucosamine pyrophosphatase LpxH
MLVFISDLHFTDRSAGVHFLPPEAFGGTFEDIARHARKARSEEIVLVLLGDVIDLIRTTRWLRDENGGPVPGSDRPWALPVNSEAVKQHAFSLLQAVEEKNHDTFAILQGLHDARFQFPVPLKRVYIPGNHDRICDQYPALRQQVAQMLGVTHNSAEEFAHEYVNLDYAVFARHGQEWDVYNFEFTDLMSQPPYQPVPWANYMKIPIGELIACEIAAKLPLSVEEALKEVDSLSPQDRDQIAARFKTIDDVRPLPAIIPWLFHRLRAEAQEYEERVLVVIKDAINCVLREFNSLPLVRQWMQEHDRWYPGDYADRLQFILTLIEGVNVDTLPVLLPLAEKLSHLWEGDNHVSEAVKEFQCLDTQPEWKQKILYVLYGHTHNPAQVPIGTVENNRARVYLNTGTWRPRYRQSVTGRGFMGWKNLTYTILYHPDRDPGSQAREAGYPTFETWTGSLLEP